MPHYLGMKRFNMFALKVSRNNTRTAWVLKCDIRKFFASVDQVVLMDMLDVYIPDQDILWLIGQVAQSFSSTASGKGLPLGNLTSQLLVNIYMNEFDQFAKHTLKARHYIRYADDFVFLSHIESFLRDRLLLELHPNKVSISTIASGVDFLGWVHFSDHRVLRTTSKRRMLRRIEGVDGRKETVQSYLGLLGHGNAYGLQLEIADQQKSTL